ncbi:MAG TPA: carbon-nitrogen hydrolase family protein [Polyangiaceae bacterium]|nr:carbon-nitrogen hydrolase family protein [Polyangiaceae bacterium]
MSRVAVIQRPPVFLNRAETLGMAVSSVREAAGAGARLVVFPEAFIPGYPAWVWRLRPGADMDLSERLHSRLLAEAVRIGAGDLAPLCDAARENDVTVVCGIDERDTELSRTTLYNSVVVIGANGTILNVHRKLMPTNPERMVWGFGDATGLRVIDTPCGRVGALICWENYMPLARYALYAQGVDVYIAPTYDTGPRWLATMQHIAREGACWVIGSGCAFQGRHLPDAVPGKAELYPNADAWVNSGDSVIVAPGGNIVAGPLHDELGVLYAELDLERVGSARRSLDVAGHYSRPDIFRLNVNNERLTPVEFSLDLHELPHR